MAGAAGKAYLVEQPNGFQTVAKELLPTLTDAKTWQEKGGDLGKMHKHMLQLALVHHQSIPSDASPERLSLLDEPALPLATGKPEDKEDKDKEDEASDKEDKDKEDEASDDDDFQPHNDK